MRCEAACRSLWQAIYGESKPPALPVVIYFIQCKNFSFVYKTIEGYRLLAGEGTDINIYLNPNDTETYISEYGERGFKQLHINTLYDLENQLYADVTISRKRKASKRRELNVI